MKRHLCAALLSTLLPGAGQFFLGRISKAILIFAVLAAICAGFWPLRLPRFYPSLVLLMWMCILTPLFAVLDALLARDTRLPLRMSRWWILVGIPLNYIGTNLIFTLLLIGSGFHTFKFASSSMEPMISVGDKFVADSRYYQRHSPNRDDLVLVQTGNAVTVKRIIAIGGDIIEGKQREIFLNNQIQNEPFVRHKFKAGLEPELDTFGPIKIPPDKYFLMGDNRDISLDSRTSSFGLIDASAIVGRPLYGYHIIDKPKHWDLH